MNWLSEGFAPPFGFWTKGHVSKEELLEEAHQEFEQSFLSVAGDFRQTYYRCVPCKPDFNDSHRMFLHEVSGPARGAFPVTVFEFA